jgi:regulator of protease activity HflC (stomatin/prohibitin superfamily)
MTTLIIGIILIAGSIILAIFHKKTAKELATVKIASLISSIVIGLIGLFLFMSLSFVIVGKDELGHLNKIFLGAAMKPGQVIALENQKGPQAKTLSPGFHWLPFIRVICKIEMKKDVSIPAGFCGKLIAKDGAPLREGEAFADEWLDADFQKMLDAEYFLTHGGQKGPQVSVLKPGTHKINRYLFDVSEKEPATVIIEGYVGVVKSNVQRKEVPTEESSGMLSIPSSSGLKAQVVPEGCRGIWQKVLNPGQYYLNTDAFKVIPVDTRVQTWEYGGGYLRRYIELKVDQNGSISQTERQEQIPVPPGAADKAITVRIEGWEIPLDSRILIQVDPEKAPYVVASVGDIEEVENDIITPTYRSILRNVCGSPERKALELIYNRAELEEKVEILLKPEGDKAFVTIKEVRFGEPAYPPELMVARLREQLAQQLNKTFQEEKKAQDQRIETEKARAQADQQPKLIEAQIKKQAAEFEKEAAKLKGEGEKLLLTEVALGQKAQVEVLGQDRVMQLAMLKEILEAAVKNPGIVKVPSVLVQGSTVGLEGAAAILGASNLTTIFNEPDAPPTPPTKE